MSKKDLLLALVIGAAVGILAQPIATNVLHGSPSLIARLGSSELGTGSRTVLFFAFLFLAPAALWVLYLLGKLLPVLYQFGKFAAVGVLNSVLNVGAINLLSILANATSGPLIPVFAVVGFLVSTTNSFFWNKFWTFQSDTAAHAAEAVKFYAIAAVNAFLNVATVSIVVNLLRPASIRPELWLNVGALCGIAVSFLLNFIGYKFFVFKRPAPAASA